MKKLIFTFAAVTISCMAIAQDKYVTSALVALQQKDLENAKKEIDKAMSSPETSEKPKALLAKAQIYFTMQQDEKYKSGSPYKEAVAAASKLAELKPDYKPEDVNQILYYGAANYFNDGIFAFNAKKYQEVLDNNNAVVKVSELNGGKRFEKTPQFARAMDTMSANALLNASRASYYMNNHEETIKLLQKVVKNPILKSAENYIIMLEAYDKYNTANGNKLMNEELAAVQEARSAFPENMNIRNLEMNTYNKYNKVAELVQKMEAEVAKDPNNGDLNYNLGVVYAGLAYPGKEGATKPTNAADLTSKAEAAFQKAIKAGPENANYNFNLGNLYFLQAYDVNTKMNDITGNSAADTKKFKDLEAVRNNYFTKSLIYFEKSISLYSAKESSLSDFDKETYRQALEASKQMYTILNQEQKLNDTKKKLENLKK